jgi:hypothetical protein
MHRTIINVITGRTEEIPQQGYKDSDNNLFVIDVGQEPEIWYIAITDEEFNAIKQIPKAPVAPDFVDMRQARAELIIRGKFSEVESYLASIPGIDGDLARNEWEYALTVRKESTLANTVASMLGWDAAAKDDFLIQASKL